MLEPEPEPYVKMEQEWEQEWEWRGKEEYVEPGEAEAPEWWEQYERPHAQQQAMQAEPMQAGVPSTGPSADRDRSITLVEQRRSPIHVKVEEAEEESANENVMLEVGVSSCSVAVRVPRVAFLCLPPCF